MHPQFAPLLHAAARIAWDEFTVHWSTVLGLAAIGALYHWRAGIVTSRSLAPLGTTEIVVVPRSAATEGPAFTKRLSFYTALVLIFLSLNGWVHDLSDFYLFSAHMVQHLVLTLVVPPLMIMGTTGAMLRPVLGWSVVGPLARWITGARNCFVIFSLVLAIWHVPAVYGLAMDYHPVHIAQHLCFMVAATLMWWPVLSPLPELPRLSYPLQMLYLFLLTLPMSLIAIWIGYSDKILYPAYSAAPRIMGISPMEDQFIGALIMWIPGGLFFFAIISVVFFRWQAQGADDSQAGAQVDWVVASKVTGAQP